METIETTDASLFQRLYTRLTDQKMISIIHYLDMDSWNRIKKDELIELRDSNIELSGFQRLFDFLDLYMPLMDKLSPETLDSKTKEAVLGFQALGKILLSKGLNVRITLQERPEFKFVATLIPKKVRVDIRELSGKYHVLGRVRNILKKGHKFDWFTIVPGLELSQEQIEEFLKSFRNIPLILGKPIQIEDIQITYPAMILSPVAIYR